MEEMEKDLKELKNQVNELEKTFIQKYTKIEGDLSSMEKESQTWRKATDDKIDNLNDKIDKQNAEMRKEFNELKDLIKTEFKENKDNFKEKCDGWEKRLGNSEFISRASVTAIVIGFASGLAKFLFFSN